MPGHTDKITKKNAVHSAVLAGFLGWTLDSFDFFVVVFLIDGLAHQFGVPKKDIVRSLMATLAMLLEDGSHVLVVADLFRSIILLGSGLRQDRGRESQEANHGE